MKLDLIKEKEIYIYPIGKYQEDFEYIFDELNVIGYIADQPNISEHHGKRAYNMSEFKTLASENSVIILCSDNIDDKTKLCAGLGNEFNDSIIRADDLFDILDEEQDIKYWSKGRRVAFVYDASIAANFGGLDSAWDAVLVLQEIPPEEREKIESQNIKVYIGEEIEELIKRNYYFVIFMNEFEKGVAFLEEHGLVVRNDFMDGKVFSHVKNSDMLRETIRAVPHQHHDCRLPLYNGVISASFFIYPCCPAGVLPKWIDYHRLYFFSPTEMWNSIWFKIFRLSVINKTYCFCDYHFCNRMIKDAVETDTRLENPVTSPRPTDIQLEIDYTCTLHCPSCRDGVKAATPYRKRMLDKIVPAIKKEGLMDDLVWTRLAGYGDVFASKYYQELLYTDKKRKNLFLITNGVLFTEDKFEPLPSMYEKIDIYISIDAATSETYAKMRPGGNWDKLNKNLNMLAEKKRQGLINFFRIQFVVQMGNYKEIPAFVALGKRLGVSDVYFNNIRNWGFPEEVYQKKNILKDDFSVKEEVLEYMRAKEVVESPKGFVVFDFCK
ncbi:MAG: hypothetical protein IKN43_14935 [Selenomonadaceae bacterium]|nr:hypothetical protein [Selenomonadaceae bacterium]